MPIPLLWAGAAITAAWAGNELAKEFSSKEGNIRVFPGDSKHLNARPVNGSVVCCGIYSVLVHTGIWIDGEIIELAGNGLLRAVSADRFLANRTGDKIYLACDASQQPLFSEQLLDNAVGRLYTYENYDLIENNCHNFIGSCLAPGAKTLTRFGQLNELLSSHFSTPTYWHEANVIR